MTTPIEAVLRYELDALRAHAAHVIDNHTNHHGTCHACGAPFPCPRACLAEHNLAICGCGPGPIVEPAGQATAHPAGTDRATGDT